MSKIDPEIKRAIANIKRRQREIEQKYGKTEDDGPLFGKRCERKQRREMEDNIDELFDDFYEN